MSDFDENAYLVAHPDVADAVAGGAFKSGWEHYCRHGKGEGRRISIEPLIFFVHVPKTAGSTINSVFSENMPNGFSHCEAFIDDCERLKAATKSGAWLSGHVDLSTAEAALSCATDRPVRYFSIMRDPMEHVRSHYNWIIEIYHRGQAFYEGHPPKIKEISETIRLSPQNPASIAANLDRFAGLFLNTQSRIILGHHFNWNSGLLHQRLDKYEFVSTSATLDQFLSVAIGAPTRVDRNENESRYHFDPAVFETGEMADFLRRKNTLDEVLYCIINRRQDHARR